jgi:hypothetical protein
MIAKVYTLGVAAIRWSGMTGELPFKAETIITVDELKTYPEAVHSYGLLIEATDNGKLPYHTIDSTEGSMLPRLLFPIDYSGYFSEINGETTFGHIPYQNRMVHVEDLKKWIMETHPNSLPPFLFDPTETASQEKVLGTKERNTLLLVIEASCALSNIKIGSKGLANRIKMKSEDLGNPVSVDSVQIILNRIKEAKRARHKEKPY